MNSHKSLRRALKNFDVPKFAALYGGLKESPSPYTYEWLFRHPDPACESSRLRYNAQKQTWICWGCGATGALLELIQVVRGVREDEAMNYLLDGYVGGDSQVNVSLKCELKTSNRRAKIRLLPELAWPAGVDLLTTPCSVHENAWRYLQSRGMDQHMVSTYKVGYGRFGRLQGYLVFPVWMDHHMVYYQARATWDPPAELSDEARKQWCESTGYKKTLNPYHDGESATASEILFNYQNASVYETVVICEGPIDAIKVGMNAVALLGKKSSPAKIERLSRMSARNYVVYLDPGNEEEKAAQELASRLSPYGRVYIAVPPLGYDPGALSPPHNAAIISQAEVFRSDRLDVKLI